MARIPAKNACTPQEIAFCRIYLAFGEKNAAEAYRRAFLVQDSDRWYLPRADGTPDADKELTPRQVSKLVKTLLGQDWIQEYIKEIARPASTHARDVLAEQAMFGDPAEARRAAEKIIDQEDKLGFRDAAERWAEVMCEAGAEIVVPLPVECNNEIIVICSNCGEKEVRRCGKQLETSAPLSRMFPQYGAPTPAEETATDPAE